MENVKSLKDFLGNEDSIDTLKKWINEEVSSSPTCVIYGKTGCGKSTLLKCLQNEYSDTLYVINATNYSLEHIENIKKGQQNPFNIKDYFSDLRTKKPIIFADNADIMNITKSFFKSPNAVKLLSTIDEINLRKCKNDYSKIIELKKPTALEIHKKFSQDKIFEDYPITLTYINEQSNDIRGMMLDLTCHDNIGTDSKPTQEITKYTFEDSLKSVRDPTEETFSILRRIYENFIHEGHFTQSSVILLELDKYNTIFQLHQNYINWTPEKDIVKSSEYLSCSDLYISEYMYDYADYIGVLGPISSLKKMNKKTRSSNLIVQKIKQ